MFNNAQVASYSNSEKYQSIKKEKKIGLNYQSIINYLINL